MGESFRNMVVWQRAIELTIAVHPLTARFPDSEKFDLTNPLRRAAVSVAILAKALGFGPKEELQKVESLCNEVGRMLNGLMKSLRVKSAANSPSLVPNF